MHLLHAPSAAAAHGFDEDRIAHLLRQTLCFCDRGDRAARHDRDAGRDGVTASFEFVTDSGKVLLGGTDENDAGFATSPGECRVFGEKSVAGMNRIGFGGAGGVYDCADVEIARRRRGGADARGVISQSRSCGVQVCVGCSEDRFDAESFARMNDAYRNLAAIGDEEPANGARLHHVHHLGSL